MGRVKRTQKTRVVNNRVSNGNGGFDIVPVTETYWDTEYVSGSNSYGSSNDGGGSYGDGGGSYGE